MAVVFDDLILNLEQQMQAMVEDKMDDVMALATSQEILADRLQKRLATGEPLSAEEQDKVRLVSNLLGSNQLLAQQSLIFSRRMIKILGGQERYNEEGLTTDKPKSSSRINFRA